MSDDPKRDLSIRTKVPIKIRYGHIAKIVSFNLPSTLEEHIALIFEGESGKHNDAPLVRLHSECLTGDVFNSHRCDCGDQLDEAIRLFSKEGGVLLYLRQEGRGIGLYNKLDAYKLQIEDGIDTFEANCSLGFKEDQRDYKPAAEMLQALGLQSIRLLSNNPEKARQLRTYGITLDDVIPTSVYLKADNKAYLKAKKEHGHLLSFLEDAV